MEMSAETVEIAARRGRGQGAEEAVQPQRSEAERAAAATAAEEDRKEIARQQALPSALPREVIGLRRPTGSEGWKDAKAVMARASVRHTPDHQVPRP